MFADPNRKCLIPHNSIEEIATAYQTATAEVRQAFALLHQAEQRIQSLSIRPSSWRLHIREIYGVSPEYADAVVKKMKEDLWYALLEKTEARSFMSSRMYNRVAAQIREGSAPEITAGNILGWLTGLASDYDGLFQEMAREVFDWLRPRRDAYKTNSKFEIGRRVIIYRLVDQWGFNYHQEQPVIALDNVFHLLDGKGVPKDPNTLRSQICAAIRGHAPAAAQVETEYFKVRWYRNGNGHLEFKRLDLLAEFHRRCGSTQLKSSGQTASKWCPNGAFQGAT